jgi:pimeloyl-ACP methyl ester carboxylesterase
MATIEGADGVRLHVEAHGEGIPVVLSCAYCTTHENFRPQVDALVAHGARVILWDFRGHGESEAPEDDAAYDMDLVVEDLHRVVAWGAGGQPAVVGGLSLGGLVSIHYALRHPDRVRGLLLIDSGPGFKNPESQARWMAQVERTGFYLQSRGLDAFLSGKAGATAIGRRPELPAARAAADAIRAQDPAALARFGRNVAGPAPGAIDLLPELDVPTLVVVGEEDDAYLKASEVLAARIPGATRVVIPGAGHIANIEEAEAFNAVVVRFLAQLAEETDGS